MPDVASQDSTARPVLYPLQPAGSGASRDTLPRSICQEQSWQDITHVDDSKYSRTGVRTHAHTPPRHTRNTRSGSSVGLALCARARACGQGGDREGCSTRSASSSATVTHREACTPWWTTSFTCSGTCLLHGVYRRLSVHGACEHLPGLRCLPRRNSIQTAAPEAHRA